MGQDYQFVIDINNESYKPMKDNYFIKQIYYRYYNFSFRMQRQINHYISSAFKLQRIKLYTQKVKKSSNTSCQIIFNSQTLDYIELKEYYDVFVLFQFCNIKNLILSQSDIEFSEKENLNEKYNFSCLKCDIESIDCSNCDIHQFETKNNIIKQIVFNYQSRIRLLGKIINVKFLTYDYLEEIVINCDNFQNIYGNDDETSFIDLSKFTKLRVVEISGIQRDILLPGVLDILLLSVISQNRKKLLNTKISSKVINLNYFDNLELFLDCEEVKLKNCHFVTLILYQQQDLSQLQNNNIEELVIQSNFQDIDLSSNKIKILTTQLRNIEILQMKDLKQFQFQDITEYTISQNKSKTLHQIIQLYLIVTDQNQKYNNITEFSDGLNLTNLINLKQLLLVLNEYFRSFREYIQIPYQLQSISLTQTCELQNSQKTHFNFSSFTNLQNIQLQGFKIKAILMFQHRFKLIFNCKYKTEIEIKCCELLQFNELTFEKYIKIVDSLKISGLKHMIIDEKDQNLLDFQIFENIFSLKLENVYKLVLLPKAIKQFEMRNDEIIEMLQNLDLKQFTLLDELFIRNCAVDNLVVPNKIQVECSYCQKYDIESIDCSNCDIHQFQMQKIFVRQIVFNQQIRIRLLGKIGYLKFLRYDCLEEIVINCDNFQNIYVNDDETSFIDLSKFTKLRVVEISGIQRDILLPGVLDILLLSVISQNRKKLLNTKISSKVINLNYFDNLELFLDCEEVKLKNCHFVTLILYQQQDLSQLQNNNIEELVIQSNFQDIDLSSNKIKILTTQLRNIEILQMKDLKQFQFQDITEYTISQNKSKTLHQIIQLYLIVTDQNQKYNNITEFSDGLNLTNLINLKQLLLVLNEYFRSFREYIQIPYQLQSISLTQTCELQNSQKTHFNFSSFTNLQNIQLQGFKIKAILMFQHRFKLIFNCKYKTEIEICCSELSQNNYQTLEQYLKNINFLDIAGLKHIVIDEKEQDVLDFQVFKNLQFLNLENVEKLVLLPKTIRNFEIKNDEMIETLQNLELSQYTALDYVYIRNCTIKNLVLSNKVQLNCYYSKINYFVKPLNAKIFKNLKNNEIKIFQQQSKQTNFNLDRQDKTLYTLVIKDYQILEKLVVQGLNNVQSELTINPNIFDFTKFPVLKEVILTDVDCQEIIFGETQQKIIIWQQNQRVSKINFIDFRNCKYNLSCSRPVYQIFNYKICKILLGKCDYVEIYNCNFKYVVYNDILDYQLVYKSCCKYALWYINNTKQQILHKFVQPESEFFLNKSMVLEYKLDYLFGQTSCILND